MASRLPIDIFLVFRDYLFDMSNSKSDPWGREEPMEKYLRTELRWSWRNFLSASNTSTWRLIRKMTMIWDLNQDFSRKYLVNSDFRKIVDVRMMYPDQQLQLTFFNFESKALIRNQVLIPFYKTSTLKSLEYLHSLRITGCDRLTHLEDCKSLRVLTISSCKSLDSVGELPNLTELYLSWIPKKLFPCLPLENLLVLKVRFLSTDSDEGLKFIKNNQSRLQNLRVLALSSTSFAEVSLTEITLSSLETADFRNFKLVDLSGFPKLQSLSVQNVRQMKGKEIIYPQLVTYNRLDSDWFLESNLNCLQKLKSLQYYSYELSEKFMNDVNCLPSLKELLLISNSFFAERFVITNKKIRMLEVSMPVKSLEIGFEKEIDTPSLSLLICGSDKFEDVSSLNYFQRISQLQLRNSRSLKNIDCLNNVSYLSITGCPNIESFSCFRTLEKLRFLEISNNHHLCNDDIVSLENLYSLKLSVCYGLTKISGLRKARFVSFLQLNEVTEMEFTGTDYVSVSLIECKRLSRVTVIGRINTLNVSECAGIKQKELPNCDCLLSDNYYL
jgi:hypothetical protein